MNPLCPTCGHELDEPLKELRVGDICLNLITWNVVYKGRRVELQPQAIGFLKYFMEHPGVLLSPSRLCMGVYGSDFSDTSNVIQTYVCAIRRAFGSRSIIRTVRQSSMADGGYIMDIPKENA